MGVGGFYNEGPDLFLELLLQGHPVNEGRFSIRGGVIIEYIKRSGEKPLIQCKYVCDL